MMYFINYSDTIIYEYRIYFYAINRKKYSTDVIISYYVIHVIIMHNHKDVYNSLITLLTNINYAYQQHAITQLI